MKRKVISAGPQIRGQAGPQIRGQTEMTLSLEWYCARPLSS